MTDRYQVLVLGPPRREGCTRIQDLEWLAVSRAQWLAYTLGDPDWRRAKEDPPTLLQRFGGFLQR